MSRIFITMGSAHSKAANVNPVDGIWCSDLRDGLGASRRI